MNDSESDPDYPELLLKQLNNSLTYVAKKVHPAITLDDFSRHRVHALGVLQMGLQRSRTWENSRVVLLNLAPPMEQSGLYEEWLPYLEGGIAQAITHEAWETLGELEFQSGFLYHLSGQYKSSEQHFRASSAAFQRYGDAPRFGRSEMRAAIAVVRQQRFAEGKAFLTQSLPLVAGNPLEEGYYHYAHYVMAASEVRHADACKAATRSLELWRQTEQPRFIGWGLANLGLALFQSGKADLAEPYLVEALTYLQQVNDPVHIGIVQVSLGNIYLMREDYPTALKWYSSSEGIIRSMQNPQNLAHLANNLGMVHHGLQKWEFAQAFYEEAIELHRSLQNYSQVGNICDNLALTFAAQQLYSEAYAVLAEGLYTLGLTASTPQVQEFYAMLNETHTSIQLLQASEAAAATKDYATVVDLLADTIADLRTTPTANNYSFFYSRFTVLHDQARDADN